jgi:hypothetical protein
MYVSTMKSVNYPLALPLDFLDVQVSVLSIDTIPPLAFTPCAAKTPPPLRGNADGRVKIAESGGRSPLMR